MDRHQGRTRDANSQTVRRNVRIDCYSVQYVGGASGATDRVRSHKTRIQADTWNSSSGRDCSSEQRKDETVTERPALLQTVVHCK